MVDKSSFDPQKDFRDSMVEMIVENNIRATRHLKSCLLAIPLKFRCSDVYLHMIVEVFEQIWFNLTPI